MLGICVYLQVTAAMEYIGTLRLKRMRSVPLALTEPVLIVFLIAFSFCVYSYFKLPPEHLPDTWVTNIRKTCPKLKEIESPRIKTFKKLLYSSIYFGIYLGCMIDAQTTGHTFDDSLKSLYRSFTSHHTTLQKCELFVTWLLGCFIASLCSLIVLKSDMITDWLFGPNLFINAVLMPVLANVSLFGYSRRIVQACGMMVHVH